MIRNWLLQQRSRAQTLALFAIAGVPLLVAVGLSVDVGGVFLQRRLAQNAADAAVLAGMRRMSTGVSVSGSEVYDTIKAYAAANGSGKVEAADLLNKAGSANASDCLPPTERIDVRNATVQQLETAQCLQVKVEKEYQTAFLGIVGVKEIEIEVTATSTAEPVIAMNGLMPLGIWSGAANKGQAAIWGTQWSQVIRDACRFGSPFANPPQAPTPVLSSDHFRDLCQYPGLNSLQGILDYPKCRRGRKDSQNIPNAIAGFNDPNTWGEPNPANVTGGPHGWSSGAYEPDPNQNLIGCYPEAGSTYSAHFEYYARFGFRGTIAAGPVAPLGLSGPGGNGNWFRLDGGNLGQNFFNNFGAFCLENGGPPVTIYVSGFDFAGDPNHSDDWSVHVNTFIGVRIDTCSPQGSLSGTVVDATVDSEKVKGTGGKRTYGKSDVVAVWLVN